MEQPEEAADARDAPGSADVPGAAADVPEPGSEPGPAGGGPESVPAPEAPPVPVVEEAPAAPVEEAPAAPAAEVAAPMPPDAVRRPRRRGRTAALIGAALVLGLVAGTCTGYLVQADREPTRLPPLSQPVLPQAKGEGPEPLSVKQDRRVKTDGDLRKLLLKKPRGAKKTDWAAGVDGWASLPVYAGYHEDPVEAFGSLLADEFRRTAETSWEDDGYFVEIRLVQFRQEQKLAAAAVIDNTRSWAEGKETGNWAIPGTGDGRVYMMKRESEPGFEPVYSALGDAWRGDVVMSIWVSGLKPVPKKVIMDLAERQMERL